MNYRGKAFKSFDNKIVTIVTEETRKCVRIGDGSWYEKADFDIMFVEA
jgi:hypothetical protein